MTGRRRLRVCVHGVVQGVGFRPFVYTTAAALGLSGSVRNDSSGAIIEVEGDAGHIDDFLTRLRDGPPPLAVIESIDITSHPGRRRHRIHHRGHLPLGRRPHAGLPRRRHVRRMRGRAARPGQPPLPARVRQLHQLRPAIHHHRLPAVRPRRNHDGRLRDVRRLRPRVRRPDRPAVPRPTRLLPELRTDAALPGRRRQRDRGRIGTAAGAAAAARRRRARGQGHRRLPPGLRRRRRTRGRRTAQAKAPRRQAVRRDGARPGRSARHRRHRRILGEGWPRGPQRPIVLMPRLPGAPIADAVAPHNPDLGVMLAYTPLHLLLFGLPGDEPGPSAAGDDVGQSRWRADLLHRRRCARPAFAPRRRLADARPADPGAVRRLGRAGGRRRRAADPALPRIRAAAHRAAGAGATDPGGGGRPEEHVGRRRRQVRLAEPAHRRHGRPRHAVRVRLGAAAPADADRRIARKCLLRMHIRATVRRPGRTAMPRTAQFEPCSTTTRTSRR